MQLSTYIRTAFALVCAAVVLVPAAGAQTRTTTLSTGERSLLTAVNEVRAAHGLRALRVDARLTAVARSHSTTLLRRNVFTHGAFASRLARSGARGPAFGENLAWGVGSRAAARRIVRDWMASPGHRANVLRRGWTRIGIGARNGRFLGYRGATVVTADFAGR